MKREAILFEDLNGKTRCCTCEKRCELSPGTLGFCQTRKNVGGKLYTLVYGDIASISANPIEKKPLFHFYPGSKALTQLLQFGFRFSYGAFRLQARICPAGIVM